MIPAWTYFRAGCLLAWFAVLGWNRLPAQTLPAQSEKDKLTVSAIRELPCAHMDSVGGTLFLSIFGDADAAYPLAKAYRDRANACDDVRLHSTAERLLGVIMTVLGKADSARLHLFRARSLARTAGAELELAEAENAMGVMYENQGLVDSALAAYLAAESHAVEIDPAAGPNTSAARIKARALLNIGNLYQKRGNDVEALSSFLTSLQICQENDLDRYLCGLQLAISKIYLGQADHLRAEAHAREALALAYTFENRNNVIRANLQMGQWALHVGDHTEARCYFEQAAQVATEMDNPGLLGEAWGELAGMDLLEGQYATGVKRAQGAIEKLVSKREVAPQPRVYLIQGRLFAAQGKHQAAVTACQRGLELAKETRTITHAADLCQCLKQGYAKLGQYQAALAALEQQRTYEDSLVNQAKTRKLAWEEAEAAMTQRKLADSLEYLQKAQLQKAAFDQERARQESSLMVSRIILAFVVLMALLAATALYFIRKQNKGLSAKNAQIARQNEIIQIALADKEMLLREVHHRVKNNLQIISSLLEMQRRDAQNPELQEGLKAAQSRIQTMALLHRNLHSNADVSELKLSHYLTQLTAETARLFSPKQMQFHLDILEEVWPINEAVVLGLILNELMTNSFKHGLAKRDAGQIWISLKKDPDGLYRVHYADDGQGLPEGFNAHRQRSLGMSIVSGLARQSKGALITCQNGPQGGIIVEFTMNVSA